MTLNIANHPDIQNIQAGTHAFFEQGNQVVIRPLNADSWKFKVGAALSQLGLSDNWNIFKSHLPVADPAKIKEAIASLLAAREARTEGQGDHPPSFRSLRERAVALPFDHSTGSLSVPDRLARTKHALQLALNLEGNAKALIDHVNDAIGKSALTPQALKDKWSLGPDNLQERLKASLGTKAIESLATAPPDENGHVAGRVAQAWINHCNVTTFSEWTGKVFFPESAGQSEKPIIDKEALGKSYQAMLNKVPTGQAAFHKPAQCIEHAQRLIVEQRAQHLVKTVGNPIPDFFAKPDAHPNLAHLQDDDQRMDAVRDLLTRRGPTESEASAIGRRMIDNALRDAFIGAARTDEATPTTGLPSSIGSMSVLHRDEARDLLVRMHQSPIKDKATSQAALAKASELVQAHLPALQAGLETIDRMAVPADRRDALVEILFDDISNRNQADQGERIKALTARLQAEGSRGTVTEVAPQQSVSTEASDLYAEVAHGETRQQLFGTGADSARQAAINSLATIGYDRQLLQSMVSALDARLQQRFDQEIEGTNAETLRGSILRDYQQQLQDMAMIHQVPGLNGAMVVAELQAQFNAVRIACKTLAAERSPSANQIAEAKTALTALHQGLVKATVKGSESENLQQLVMAQMGRQFAGQPARLSEELITMSKGLTVLGARESARKSFLGRGGQDPVVVATLGALSDGARAMLAQVNALG